jgi:hypothetical protein
MLESPASLRPVPPPNAAPYRGTPRRGAMTGILPGLLTYGAYVILSLLACQRGIRLLRPLIPAIAVKGLAWGGLTALLSADLWRYTFRRCDLLGQSSMARYAHPLGGPK